MSTRTLRPSNAALMSTRQQIVGVARELIQTRSYLGFSFQDVANRVGIRKASLYHHFPTKESLGVEVLRDATRRFRLWSAVESGTPVERIDAYFAMLRNSLKAGEGLCPTGALAPGWGVIDDELRQAVRILRNEHMLWLSGVLGGLAAPGQGVERANGPSSAAYVFATCQGALASSRITGRVQDFDDVVAQLRASLRI